MNTPEAWQVLVNAALLGTGRQPFQSPSVEGSVAPLFNQLEPLAPERRLLSMAAILTAYHQAGYVPPHSEQRESSPDPCPPDPQPRCNRQAEAYFKQLQGELRPLMREWLDHLAQQQQRVPESCLPELLTVGSRYAELRPHIQAVMGERGRWLAAQNPDWQTMVNAVPQFSQTLWDTGERSLRLQALAQLRAQDPTQARELLAQSWQQEPAVERRTFLPVLAEHLSLEDEPFLEAALDDRTQGVRHKAVTLLVRLPLSRLSQRMQERLVELVKVSATDPITVDIRLPSEVSPAMVRDGISQDPPRQMGEKAWILQQLVASAPLALWTEAFPLTIAAWLKQAQTSEVGELLLKGWTLATIDQQDPAWAEALFCSFKVDAQGWGQLVQIIPPERMAVICETFPTQQLSNIKGQMWQLLPAPWPAAVGDLALRWIQAKLQQEKQAHWEMPMLLDAIALQFPWDRIPTALKLKVDHVDDNWQTLLQTRFFDVLRFRQSMAAAIHHSDSQETPR